MSTTKPGIDEITLDRVKYLVEQIQNAVPYLRELAGVSEETREAVEKQVADYALSVKMAKLNPEALEAFFKKPYHLMPVHGKQDSWHLIIPRWIDIQIGWLESQTESYNIFLVSRFMEWLGEIPDALKKQLGWKPPPDLVLEGEDLVGSPAAMDEAWAKYRPLGVFKDRDEKAIHINQKRSFELLVAMLKDGIKPFSARPVDKADLIERKFDFELRDYQQEAWRTFLRFSNVGVFYPASTGKTVIGLYIATHVKGPILIVVPTRILQEQWLERIEAHTDLKPGEFAVLTYQAAIKKASNQEWGVMIIDETHHLPANIFSKLSFIKRKYTVGLSATPQREDGREEYIFALTGQPIGLSWEHFKKLGIIKSPTSNVWIVKDQAAKFKRLDSLLQESKRTIIFCDHIELGKSIAARYKVPYIYGEVQNRYKLIRDSPLVVVSRVGDEGVSLPEIERVIEFDWLGGSRRQELQRFTRLLHGHEAEGEGEHHIIMALNEYLRDRKRLFSIMDKGFKLVLHREGISDKVIEQREREPIPRALRPTPRPSVEQAQLAPLQPMAPAGSGAAFLEVPGVKRMMEAMDGTQRKVFSLLVQNDGTYFKKSKLQLLLGYGSLASLENHARFAQMVAKGWLQQTKIDGELAYRTNFREMVA